MWNAIIRACVLCLECRFTAFNYSKCSTLVIRLIDCLFFFLTQSEIWNSSWNFISNGLCSEGFFDLMNYLNKSQQKLTNWIKRMSPSSVENWIYKQSVGERGKEKTDYEYFLLNAVVHTVIMIWPSTNDTIPLYVLKSFHASYFAFDLWVRIFLRRTTNGL